MRKVNKSLFTDGDLVLDVLDFNSFCHGQFINKTHPFQVSQLLLKLCIDEEYKMYNEDTLATEGSPAYKRRGG